MWTPKLPQVKKEMRLLRISFTQVEELQLAKPQKTLTTAIKTSKTIIQPGGGSQVWSKRPRHIIQ
ncbi:MAG: hypothetical protein QXU44_12605, partial [Candidatus Caldarchaeum sp.]